MSYSEIEMAERLMGRCGSDDEVDGPSLVIDTLLPPYEWSKYNPAYEISHHRLLAMQDGVDWMVEEPVWAALQAADTLLAEANLATSPRPVCPHCAPPLPLSVVQASRSGNRTTGFHEDEFEEPDHEKMYELGLDGDTFNWAAPVVVADEGAPPNDISPEEAPQLWAQATSTAGYVLLRWARTSKCEHEEALPAVPADSVRRLMKETCLLLYSREGVKISSSGPAVNVTYRGQHPRGTDHIPCLHLPWWPEKNGFLRRSSGTNNFPFNRENICDFGAHLVPAGCPGSPTEQVEWCVSMSRAEMATAIDVNRLQRAVLKAVKYIHLKLKDRGATPALKSHYVQTAVLWLAQEEPKKSWENLTASVLKLLDWLERHLKDGHMPCFFWAGRSLLSGVSRADIDTMLRTVELMKSKTKVLLFVRACDKFPEVDYSLNEVFTDGRVTDGDEENDTNLAIPLTVRQMRFRLARLLTRAAVVLAVKVREKSPHWVYWSKRLIWPMEKLGERRLLQWLKYGDSAFYPLNCYLMHAQFVGPTYRVFAARPNDLDDYVQTYDACPLMNLVTRSDLHNLHDGDWSACQDWWLAMLHYHRHSYEMPMDYDPETVWFYCEYFLLPDTYAAALARADSALTNARIKKFDEETGKDWKKRYPERKHHQQMREDLKAGISEDAFSMEQLCRDRLPAGSAGAMRVAAYVRVLREFTQYLVSGDRFRNKHDDVTRSRIYRWRMRDLICTDPLPPADGDRERRAQERAEEERQFRREAMKRCGAYLTSRNMMEPAIARLDTAGRRRMVGVLEQQHGWKQPT